MRHPANRCVLGASRGLMSPMHVWAFNDLLPCTIQLRLAVAMLSMRQEMVEPTCTGPTHGFSFKGLVTPMNRVWGGAIMEIPPCQRQRERDVRSICHVCNLCYAISCGFPHDPTLVRAHYAMTVWAVRRVLLLPVLMYESVQS